MKNRNYIESLIGRAKKLRKDSTPAEKKLWEALQKIRPETGIKFRRQKPIGPYIADFYCAFNKCIVEIDGSSHDHRLEKDQIRDASMKEKGYRVLRFAEKETFENCEGVVESILAFCGDRTPAPLSSAYALRASADEQSQTRRSFSEAGPPPEGEGK